MPQRPARRPILAALLFGAAFAAAAIPPAAAQQQGAVGFVQNLGMEGLQAIAVPEPQRSARLRQVLQADFDLPGIAAFVLGPYGRALPPQQQQEFVGLLGDYIARAYADRLAVYAGSQFQVTGVRPYGGETVVATQVIRPGAAPAYIDWHVVGQGGAYRISDVVVSGVSMKISERNDFAGIIQRSGGRPEALFPALRQQLGGYPYGSSAPWR